MVQPYMIHTNMDFIIDIGNLGGRDMKKCYQCATCSVVCTLAPDDHPFPRKEMIAASWGLKDRIIGNPDIWLCHHCGDCSRHCPRGARPGDVLAAARTYTIGEYARPRFVARALNDPKKLPILMAVPVLLLLALGLVTGLLDFTPKGDRVVHAKFISTWLVDMVMLPAAFWSVLIFGISLKRFIGDMHGNALSQGKAVKKEISVIGFIKALVRVVPSILKHDAFGQCQENHDRSTSHFLVFYGFLGLFIVTAVFFFQLAVLKWHGPYSQLHPIKWLANISSVALISGSVLLIRNRLSKAGQTATYMDWLFIYLVFGLGVTGMAAQVTRLLEWAFISYSVYFIHLVLVWCMFAYLPYSRFAHVVYRTIAMTYREYVKKESAHPGPGS